MRDFGRFKFLTGDVDYLGYGGKWCREVAPGRYHIISVFNWEDMCGEREAAEVGSTYCMELDEVDLGSIPEAEIRSALESCGVEWDTPLTSIWIAEACHSYGCKAPLESHNTSNFHKTFRELARESRSLDDPGAHALAMAKTVNGIGSTAAEYMAGDIYAALRRSQADPTPTQALVLKMYGACTHTLGGTPIPADLAKGDT